MTDTVSKEDLKARLRAKVEMSKISRLPKDIKEEKIEKLKATVTTALMKGMDAGNSPIDFSVQTP